MFVGADGFYDLKRDGGFKNPPNDNRLLFGGQLYFVNANANGKARLRKLKHRHKPRQCKVHLSQMQTIQLDHER
jgi:hypothetical protein